MKGKSRGDLKSQRPRCRRPWGGTWSVCEKARDQRICRRMTEASEEVESERA